MGLEGAGCCERAASFLTGAADVADMASFAQAVASVEPTPAESESTFIPPAEAEQPQAQKTISANPEPSKPIVPQQNVSANVVETKPNISPNFSTNTAQPTASQPQQANQPNSNLNNNSSLWRQPAALYSQPSAQTEVVKSQLQPRANLSQPVVAQQPQAMSANTVVTQQPVMVRTPAQPPALPLPNSANLPNPAAQSSQTFAQISTNFWQAANQAQPTMAGNLAKSIQPQNAATVQVKVESKDHLAAPSAPRTFSGPAIGNQASNRTVPVVLGLATSGSQLVGTAKAVTGMAKLQAVSGEEVGSAAKVVSNVTQFATKVMIQGQLAIKTAVALGVAKAIDLKNAVVERIQRFAVWSSELIERVRNQLSESLSRWRDRLKKVFSKSQADEDAEKEQESAWFEEIWQRLRRKLKKKTVIKPVKS